MDALRDDYYIHICLRNESGYSLSEYFPINNFHTDSFHSFKPQMIVFHKIINKYANYSLLGIDLNVYSEN